MKIIYKTGLCETKKLCRDYLGFVHKTFRNILFLFFSGCKSCKVVIGKMYVMAGLVNTW